MKNFLTYNNFLNEGNSGGDCYQAAADLVLNGGSRRMSFSGKPNDYVLVHGMVDGQGSLTGIRYGHAWVEHKGKVLDYSNGREIQMDKAEYYRLGHIDKKNNIYYNNDEVRKWVLKTKQWGPWEMTGDPVALQEGIPTKSNEIGEINQKVSSKDLKQIKEL